MGKQKKAVAVGVPTTKEWLVRNGLDKLGVSLLGFHLNSRSVQEAFSSGNRLPTYAVMDVALQEQNELTALGLHVIVITGEPINSFHLVTYEGLHLSNVFRK